MTHKKPMMLVEAAQHVFGNAKLPEFIDQSTLDNPYTKHIEFRGIEIVADDRIPHDRIVTGIDPASPDGDLASIVHGHVRDDGVLVIDNVIFDALLRGDPIPERKAGPNGRGMIFEDADFTDVPALEDKTK